MPQAVAQCTTTCLVPVQTPGEMPRPCGHRFTGPPLNIPIVGKSLVTELARRVQRMQQHLTEHHRDFVSRMATANVLMFFATDDELLQEAREEGRQQLFAMARRQPPTDQEIREQVKLLDREQFAEYCCALRDALCEIGKFGPQQPMVQPANGINPRG